MGKNKEKKIKIGGTIDAYVIFFVVLDNHNQEVWISSVYNVKLKSNLNKLLNPRNCTHF